jgi:DNA-binding LacI/PurR family transcriptional regulator
MKAHNKRAKTDTLKSIAEEIGVSPAVVTRTLRNNKSTIPVSKETKRRILEIAARKGIRTNKNICVFISEEQTRIPEYFNTFIAGVFIQGEKYSVNIRSCVYKKGEKSLENHEFLRSREISGAIFFHETPTVFRNFLAEEMIPSVTVNPLAVTDSNCVTIDNYGAMSLLLNELEKQGYKKYVLMSYVPSNNYMEKRIESLENFISNKGYAGRVIIVQEKNLPSDFEKEIKISAPDTVFITDAKFLTVKILELFAVNGKTIPHDGGLVGNGLIDYDPGITHVKYPYSDMGAAAVDMIYENWKNHNVPVKNIVLQGSVVTRKSTGV